MDYIEGAPGGGIENNINLLGAQDGGTISNSNRTTRMQGSGRLSTT